MTDTASRASRAKPASGAGKLLVVLAALFAGCVAGLFSRTMDLYDESILVLGARLVRAGQLPYVDFYAHYGPLGFNLMSWFLPVGNPGLALRLAQSAAVFLVAGVLLGLWRTRRKDALGWTAAALVGLIDLQITTALAHPHFFGYALALTAVGLLLGAEGASNPSTARAAEAASGACLGLAALVRPAFGVYACAGMAAFLWAAHAPARAARRLAVLLFSALGAAGLTWLLLYRDLPLSDAYVATFVVPTRLTQNSSRFVLPRFGWAGWSPDAALWLGGLHLAALFALATLGAILSRQRAARWTGLAGTAAAALLVVALGSSQNPSRLSSYGTLLLFVVAAAAWRLARPPEGAGFYGLGACLCGLMAIAFFHYYLTRADHAHMTPALALSTAAGILALPGLSRLGRCLAAVLLVAALRSPTLAVERSLLAGIGRAPAVPSVSTSTGFGRRWPASMFPSEAVDAVKEADRAADPASRFVAAASDHSSAEGSAVILFVLSSRLPYTKYYQYDPGVQTSALIQARMEEELERSGSRSAVLWSARSFGGPDPGGGAPPATPLDRRIRELYPVEAARFGGLTLRLR